MNHDGSSFLSAVALYTDLFFVAKESDELMCKGTHNSSFFIFNSDDWEKEQSDPDCWAKYAFNAPWSAIAMETEKLDGKNRRIVAVSTDGDYWEMNPVTLEDSRGKIATFQYPIRALCSVDDMIFHAAWDAASWSETDQITGVKSDRE